MNGDDDDDGNLHVKRLISENFMPSTDTSDRSCVLVFDRAQHRHMWIHWIMSFYKKFIGVNVSVFMSCLVFVCLIIFRYCSFAFLFSRLCLKQINKMQC